MGQTLHLHKRGELGGPVTHVELESDVPETHIFSEPFVTKAVAEGWMEFSGSPLEYDIFPDPLGEHKGFANTTKTLEGDHLTLHLRKDGKDVDVVYKITHVPVPRGFRTTDDREPDGLRIAPEYGVELEG